jgi:hypothetical protein
MKLKDLLLNTLSFKEILTQFGIDNSNIIIENEELILANQGKNEKEIVKEQICIQGMSNNSIVNFFGTLHYNLLNQLAVFEPEFIEKNNLNAA